VIYVILVGVPAVKRRPLPLPNWLCLCGPSMSECCVHGYSGDGKKKELAGREALARGLPVGLHWALCQ
jgi:hypothetical protein